MPSWVQCYPWHGPQPERRRTRDVWQPSTGATNFTCAIAPIGYGKALGGAFKLTSDEAGLNGTGYLPGRQAVFKGIGSYENVHFL